VDESDYLFTEDFVLYRYYETENMDCAGYLTTLEQ
jgi:hypothetical protein